MHVSLHSVVAGVVELCSFYKYTYMVRFLFVTLSCVIKPDDGDVLVLTFLATSVKASSCSSCQLSIAPSSSITSSNSAADIVRISSVLAQHSSPRDPVSGDCRWLQAANKDDRLAACYSFAKTRIRTEL